MDKSMVIAVVDAVVVFLGFFLSKYLPPEWGDAVKSLLVAFQPVVIFLICKWLNIEQLRALGLLK
jgi:hypothetical protein